MFNTICNYSVTVANSLSTDRSGAKQCWLSVGIHLAGGGRSIRKSLRVPVLWVAGCFAAGEERQSGGDWLRDLFSTIMSPKAPLKVQGLKASQIQVIMRNQVFLPVDDEGTKIRLQFNLFIFLVSRIDRAETPCLFRGQRE